VAAVSTNVELLTWDEFQNFLEASWLANHFTPTITTKLYPLVSFSEPFAPEWFSKLPEDEKEAIRNLKGEYNALGWFSMSLSSYTMQLVRGYPSLPLKELPETCLQIGETAIAAFRAIRDRNHHSGGE
jgi:hypothetical protein